MGEYINSRQVQIEKSRVSCGVLEMHHLPDENPAKTVLALANHLYHKANPRPASYAIFSDVVDKSTPSRGQRLASYIVDYIPKCVVLLATKPETNPRTGNLICLWSLRFIHEEFRKWYTEEVMNRIGAESE